MKTRFSFLAHIGTGLVALLFMVVISCKGPDGPAGPQGTTGSTGPQGVSGVAGPQGPMGNANVVYTAWKAVDLSGNYFRTPDNLRVDLGNADKTANALLTKEVMDKSLVYIYYKFGQSLYDIASAEYKLNERIAANFGSGQVKIPGRTTNGFDDYVSYSVSQDWLGVNYLRFNLTLFSSRFDPVQNKQVPVAELLGANAQTFRDLLKDLPQYRIVIVNGSIPGGRAATIDYKDYAAVKWAYNLPD